MSDRFRLAVDTTGGGRLEVAVLNEQGRQTGERFVVNGDEGSKIIPLGPGTFRLELQESGLRHYRVTVQECRAAAAAASDSDTTQITAAAQTTAAQASPITAAEATTSNAAARAGTAGEVTNADAFRCELFLRVSRDGRGALVNQYRGDELMVQRIEQCFSEDVLRDTIPKRLLPDTGGPALLGLAALGLASIVAGASVLGAGLRRRR